MSDSVILDQVEGFLDEILESESTYFKVKFKVKPTNNYKIFIDGDQGITIDQCIKFNRALYKKIEEAGLYPDGDFSLEVSSPGVDEPLQNIRQYKKNTGRKVEITLLDERKLEGILKEVQDETVTIEETKGKGKKAVTEVTLLPFKDIKTTIVQIQF
ncbi:ribosome assembly cofactor RimP [Arachidicoccus ginsenosidivorans]|uniref:Ribosome maturation factor RimP n=1 Tax=Arachidicoccus ginsenosidivorans TaxID=496057 RepID=A0A5B8VIY2_9BACT|nr:ribosome maturation factor [Arachidicoccus ginsenosidivorans]QEC71450.1 ribosome maturation factor [Arachidicoccus ginsenosidivorans]